MKQSNKEEIENKKNQVKNRNKKSKNQLQYKNQVK